MSRIAVRAGKLIDGTGGPPLDNALILIEDGKFRAVVEAGSAIPEGYEVMDARKYTVLPGLIDCHLHISGSGDPREREDSPFRSIPAFTLACYTNAAKDLEAG